MKLSILQENLNKSVNLTSRFASARAQLPILGNILLKTNKTKLTLLSTNLEISIATALSVKVESEGEIAIPAKVLSELVSNLPKEAITLETDKEQLKISTSGFSSVVMGMNSADFPKVPVRINKDNSIQLSKDAFAKSIEKVIFAVSSDETRPILTGVLFVFDNDNLTFVATDGFRLSLVKIDNLGLKIKNSVVIPKNILSEIPRIEEGEYVNIEFKQDDKQIIFGLGDVTLSSRLIEGEFPNYEKIIPKSSKISVLVDKEDLLRAVKLASIFSRDNANIVKLKILKENIKVFAESSSSGSQETKVEAKVTGGGEDFEIAFNYKFLEDFINSVSGEEIKIEFTETDKPGVFLDTSNTNYLHLIMPVKIQG